MQTENARILRRFRKDYFEADIDRTVPSGHMVTKWRRVDVDATSSRRIGVNAMSVLRYMPAGLLLDVIKMPSLHALTLAIHNYYVLFSGHV